MAAIHENGKLTLSGFVGEDMFGDGFTYAQVLTALAEADGDLVVHINSGGGFAAEGAAIYALLAARPGRTDVVVDGEAASAASLVAMAGETVTMSLGSHMMVHDPATITIGNSEDHQRSVAQLEALSTTYARVYAEKTGQDVERMRAVMQREEWMTPEQAVEQGFADAIGQHRAQPAAAMDYRVYAHAPKELVAMAAANGWHAGHARKSAAASAAASTSDHKETTMTDKTKADAATAQKPAATPAPAGGQPTAEADIEAAKAQAVKADRERRAAIMALDEAKGREALAEHLYGTTEMSAEEIKGALAKAPVEAAQTQTQPAGEPDRAHVAGAGLGGAPKTDTRPKAEIKPSEIYAARRPQ